MTPEFDKWIADLIRLAPEYEGAVYEDWGGYFEDGYTPQEAVDEDRSHD